ncbi:MAG: putative O-glycosylation ligase, exosortase A system-associated [Nitrococcus mobilis]|nr:putative O-glycosylation ligase, exosortase A system-associated [Nitrococcus mobilis]
MGLRDVLIIAIIGVLAVIALRRAWIGVLGWSWLGYMNPHKLTWAAQQYPLAQGIAAATIMGLLFTQDRRPPPLTFETVLLLLLGFWFTLTTVFAWYPQVAWVQWNAVFKIFLFTFVTMMLIFGRFRIHLLFVVIALSIGFYGVKGGLFSILTGGSFRVWGPGNSFIGDNNGIGLALNMTLPLALLVAREESRRSVRIALYAVFWLSVPAVIFTYSRGAFLGLVIVMGALFWRYRARMFLLAVVAALVLVLAKDYLPERWVQRQESTLDYQEDTSAMQRIQAWGVAWNIAKDRPLLGAGFNFEFADNSVRWLSYANFLGSWENQTRAAHSIYFQILGQHGIAGFILFMMLLLGTFWRLHRLGRMEYAEDMAWIGRYAKAMEISLLPYMVSGAFLSFAYFDLYYAYVGISAILHREWREAQAAAAIEVLEREEGEVAPVGLSGTRGAIQRRNF